MNVISNAAPLFRAILWLALVGLAVLIGQAVMGQIRNPFT